MAQTQSGSEPALGDPGTWTNWVGNQTFTARHVVAPETEEDVARLVRGAAARRLTVRIAGAGHSFTPVVQTDGLLLDLARLSGIVDVDAARGRAVVGAGSSIRDLGEPLWEAGLALRNQGDIDTQQIGGAVSTGTHGSGLGLASLSATVRALRLVTAAGDVVDIDGSRPKLLRAAQVSVGMLGAMTRLELDVTAAYRLRERIEHEPYDEVIRRFEERAAAHRHFSFFWLPTEDSAALYDLATPAGARMTDTCYVKVYDEADRDQPDDDATGRRVDRSYRIYPAEFAPNFHELEYFVPLERGVDAIAAMRALMLRSLPDSAFPLEVRTTAADDALLSPSQGTPTVVLSVSGIPGTDYWPYLRAVDRTLAPFDARVHWGKLHFMTRERLDVLYPGAEAFRRIRRELDPDGVFLNGHLAELFA